jgi:hypothetical protein
MVIRKDDIWRELCNGHKDLENNKEFLLNIVKSMPKRLNCVIENQGLMTKY